MKKSYSFEIIKSLFLKSIQDLLHVFLTPKNYTANVMYENVLPEGGGRALQQGMPVPTAWPPLPTPPPKTKLSLAKHWVPMCVQSASLVRFCNFKPNSNI